MLDDILAKSYLNDESIISWVGNIRLKIVEVGELNLPTGQICACDPLVCSEYVDAFVKKVSPGKYCVRLSLAHIETDQRVAFAMLQFSEEPASNWELALIPGQEEKQFKEGEIYGYPVDSGTGCFMDKATAEVLSSKFDRDDKYYEKIIAEMDKTYVTTWSCANLVVSGNLNLICYSTGFGDGVYATYFGFGTGDEPVCLVTDFEIAHPPDKNTHDKEVMKPTRKWWQLWKR